MQAVQYHSVIKITLQLMNQQQDPPVTSMKKAYLYNKANWHGFSCDFNDFVLCPSKDINCMFSELNEKIDSVATKFIPLAHTSKHSRRALPNYIINSIKSRNRLQRKFKKNKSQYNKNQLYNQIDKVKNEITEFKSSNWSNFINKLGTCPTSSKAYWNRINRIRNKKAPNSIPNLNFNGTTLDTDESKAVAFGEKLANTFSDQVENSSSFNNINKDYVDDIVNSKSYIPNYKNKTFFPIELHELDEAIKKLNNKTSLDNHYISNKIIKKLPLTFKRQLLIFFNKSIIDSELPIVSKQAIITMIGKKGSATDIKNYRPISSTSCLIKLLEKIIHSRVTKFLVENGTIINQQSGFRKNRQTKDNLIYMSQKILEAFGKRKKVCCIFFDIQAAFDKIWHNGLIFKLIKLKFPLYLVQWIKNFLTNRTFTVKIGNVETEKYNITCSTPQGTVLSPLLFSIFINDIPIFKSNINKHSLLFADDLMYMYTFSKINQAVEVQLNKQTVKLEKWLNDWRLKMAPHKCMYSIFSQNKKAGEKGKKGFNNENLNIKIYGENITLDNNATFLGLRFDKFLNFKNQIAHIKSSCNNRLNIMKVLAHKSWNINTKTQIQLYKTLVRSIFDYSSFIFPTLTGKSKRKLQFIQDSALRIIYKKNFEFDTTVLHEMAEIETLEERATKLLTTYFDKANINNNQLIENLIEGYDHYNNNYKNENVTTILDFILL